MPNTKAARPVFMAIHHSPTGTLYWPAIPGDNIPWLGMFNTFPQLHQIDRRVLDAFADPYEDGKLLAAIDRRILSQLI